jgi:hypothetical protein
MKEDLNKMAANFESFTAVITMVSKAVSHSATIFNDAYKASTDYEAHQMVDFGKDLGDIVKVVLIDDLESPIDVVVKAAEAVRGLCDSAFQKTLPNLVKCVDDVEEIIADLDVVVDDFLNGDVSHIINGIQKIGDIISHIPDAIMTCP